MLDEIKHKKIPYKIYACGPKPMLEKVSMIAKKYDIKCEVSLEEKMACGFGICMGCSIKTKMEISLYVKMGQFLMQRIYFEIGMRCHIGEARYNEN